MELNCLQIHSAEDFHKALAQALAFPEWYGHNLDALYDCLTDLEEETTLTLLHFPHWADDFREVMEDAMEQNPNLHILMKA